MNDYRKCLLASLFTFLAGFAAEKTPPTDPPAEPSYRPASLTLVVDEGAEGLCEIDPDGKLVWNCRKVPMVHSGRRLPNGNTLAGSIRKKAVMEVDREGNVVWEIDVDGYPVDVDPLPKGNVLVTRWYNAKGKDGTPHRVDAVTEYDCKGAVVWEYKDLNKPWGAQRLANGNTLIADSCHNRAVEVDPAGTVVWEAKNLGNPNPKIFNHNGPVDVQRLENGNTLVAVRAWDKVVEIDRSGKTVWECHALRPFSAQRLKNGNTLIAENGKRRVIEVDPAGKIVWKQGNYGYLGKAYRLEE